MYDIPPKKRSDCAGKERPCPWVRCKHHMVWATHGYARLSDDEIVDLIFSLSETCVLDVADRGGATLEQVGAILGITRERVRQLEGWKRGGAIRKLRHAVRRHFLEDYRDN